MIEKNKRIKVKISSINRGIPKKEEIMMDFMQPPPMQSNFSVPPPSIQQSPQPGLQNNFPPRERHFYGGFSGKSGPNHGFRHNRGGNSAMSQDDFDGKRLRKSVMRKTVDYNSSIVRALEVNNCAKIRNTRKQFIRIFLFFLLLE